MPAPKTKDIKLVTLCGCSRVVTLSYCEFCNVWKDKYYSVRYSVLHEYIKPGSHDHPTLHGFGIRTFVFLREEDGLPIFKEKSDA